jgi:hypothetical protein
MALYIGKFAFTVIQAWKHSQNNRDIEATGGFPIVACYSKELQTCCLQPEHMIFVALWLRGRKTIGFEVFHNLMLNLHVCKTKRDTRKYP